MAGFIYIFSNPSLEGLKIGKTKSDPAERARELSTTSVPSPFKVEYFAFVDDHDRVETDVHAQLGRFRKAKNREFFNCSDTIAIDAIRTVAGANIRFEEITKEKEIEVEQRRVHREKERERIRQERKIKEAEWKKKREQEAQEALAEKQRAEREAREAKEKATQEAREAKEKAVQEAREKREKEKEEERQCRRALYRSYNIFDILLLWWSDILKGASAFEDLGIITWICVPLYWSVTSVLPLMFALEALGFDIFRELFIFWGVILIPTPIMMFSDWRLKRYKEKDL
jgi:hypothetical protein